MKLKNCLKNIIFSTDSDISNIDITSIEYDSRKVKMGSLFVAIPGYKTDGHKFISRAAEKGASACMVSKLQKTNCPQILVKNTREALAGVSRNFYKLDDLPLLLVGVTGTNGKTTLVHCLYSLSEYMNEKPARIGTLGATSPDGNISGERTTPESSDLAALFRYFADHGIKTVFMEVSSHALALKRVEKLQFRVAVFTNLTQDHLDFHENMEDYYAVKKQLFSHLDQKGCAAINIDDSYGKRFTSEYTGQFISYSISDPHADIFFRTLVSSIRGIRGTLSTPLGDIEIDTPMIGIFNAENIAGTIAAWLCLHPEIKPKVPKDLFKPVAGRMELIQSDKSVAVIDYAHTPDALKKALRAAHLLQDRGRIITVFGCGGNRDKHKRSLMGCIAETYSDIVILTNDNPRNEDPKNIINDILFGIKNRGKCMIVEDRGEAIENAWFISDNKDIIMIMGKGAEDYIDIADKRIPFSDKDKINEMIKMDE